MGFGLELKLRQDEVHNSSRDFVFDIKTLGIDVLAHYLAYKDPFRDTSPEKLVSILAFSPGTTQYNFLNDAAFVSFLGVGVFVYSFMGKSGNFIKKQFRDDLVNSFEEGDYHVLGYAEFDSFYGYMVLRSYNDESQKIYETKLVIPN